MKVKDGKLVLSKNDRRLGNFVLTEQPEHWKISDINDRFSTRVHKTTLVGRSVTYALNGSLGENYLPNLAVVLYETALTALDSQAMQEIVAACRASVERHPELYGGKAEPATEKDDAEAIKDVRATESIIEKAKSNENGED